MSGTADAGALDVRVAALPTRTDGRGDLAFFQVPDQLPFPIGRVTWQPVVAGGRLDADGRAPVALVLLRGRATLAVGTEGARVVLADPAHLLHAPAGAAIHVLEATPDAVCLRCHARS